MDVTVPQLENKRLSVINQHCNVNQFVWMRGFKKSVCFSKTSATCGRKKCEREGDIQMSGGGKYERWDTKEPNLVLLFYYVNK